MKVTGPEAANAFKYDHICAVLKTVTDEAVHGVQSIWDPNYTKVKWVFFTY